MKRPSKSDALSVSIAGAAELPFLAAAHLMTEDAYVLVERDGKAWTARLSPKAGKGTGLASAFRREYENQVLRWKVAEANLDLKAETVRRALALLDGPRATAGGGPGLTPDQRAEIDRLVAESESAPVEDDQRIRVPWSELKRGR